MVPISLWLDVVHCDTVKLRGGPVKVHGTAPAPKGQAGSTIGKLVGMVRTREIGIIRSQVPTLNPLIIDEG